MAYLLLASRPSLPACRTSESRRSRHL
jgi:hypothetical protein